MQPLRHRETSTRSRQVDPRIQQAKGLGLELKNLLKSNDPWDRQVEFQRDATRKAYLKVIFSTPSLTSSSLALLSSTRSSSSLASASQSTALEALNLVWLETTHALITIYRSKLAKMDKQIAENPKPPSRKSNPSRDRRGGNDGNVQYAQPPHLPLTSTSATATTPPVVGPVARRKLLQQFQKFLTGEQEFWKIIVNRLSSRLYPPEQLELRPLGIIATRYDDTNTSSQEVEEEEEVSEEEKKRRRLQVLPLVHKTLICFGDLARYIEYHSDLPLPAPATGGGGGGGRGGKRGGKKDSRAVKAPPIKSYAKAAECYRQANLLLPDDGNSHNQLAVLSQYASDPLASVYHYYRALAVRIPFSTAIKNLNIAYSKSLQRYDFQVERRKEQREQEREEEGEGEGDEVDIDRTDQLKRFREAFMALHGIFFTKTKLTELSTLMSRVERSFDRCTRERLITSDGVLKVVVTSLAALWHARMTRSKSLNDNSTLNLSRSKTTSLAPTTGDPTSGVKKPSSKSALIDEPSGGGGGGGPKLEAHILVHVLQLYTTLLSASSIETNELFTSNLNLDQLHEQQPEILVANAGATDDVSTRLSLESNISAVLRRSVPALRILGRWLKGQLDYIERLEKRVVDKEKKRLRLERRKARTSGGTSSFEEAQRQSLESSGEGGGEGGTVTGEVVVGSKELEDALDRFWMAFADYSNSLKLAFSSSSASSGDLPALEEGVWLEEDVECLGFSPLRRSVEGSAGGEASAREGARRVGRDVHPNQEVLMRVEEALRLAEEIVDSPFSRVALVDGAYIFVPREEPALELDHDETLEPRADLGTDEKMDPHAEALEGGEDVEMRDQSTEDDPIDRAMRTATGQLELDGVDEEESADDDSEDDDDEQIVFSGSRNSSQPPIARQDAEQTSAVLPAFPPRQENFPSRSPNRASPLTAADLRQQLFAPGPPRPPHPANGNTTPSRASSQPPAPASHVSPSLLAPSSDSSSPNTVSSIWGAPPASHVAHAHSHLVGPSHFPPPPQQHLPMTPHSFEAIPNLTHNAFTSAHQLGWNNGSSRPSPLPPHSASQPPSIPPAQLFGGHPAFALAPAPLATRFQSQPPPPQPPLAHYSPQENGSANDYGSRSTSSHSLSPNVPLQPQIPFHCPPPLPPGLSTAHVGLNPSPLPASPMRINSNGGGRGGGGFGFSLPPPTGNPGAGGGGWPTSLGGS